jgi:hypothetical protein
VLLLLLLPLHLLLSYLLLPLTALARLQGLPLAC